MATDVAAPPAKKPLPPGAVRWSLRTEVLTDGTHQMVPVAVDAAGEEVAEPKPPRRSPLAGMPWRSARHRMRHVFPPAAVVAGVVGVAALVDSYDTPAQYVAAGTVAATALAYRLAPRYLIRGKLAEDPPAGRKRPTLADLVGRAAELVRRRQRLAAYITAAAGSWVTMAGVTGLNPATDGHPAVVAWGMGAALATAAGYPYVAHARPRTAEPTALEEPAAEGTPFGLVIAARWSDTVGAVAQPARTIPAAVRGEEDTQIPARAAGKLPGTVLEDVHRVAGGWAATAADPLSRGLEWTKDEARRQISAVFNCGIASVTLEPDTDDANQCFVMVQKQSPLRDVVRWAGPRSINAERGTGMAGLYADATVVDYEVYRRGFGCPHDLLCGTTGSGKSETFQALMVIDRWMHHVDDAGNPFGLVADILLDPQHGQSFGPFLNDLAAPVATSLDEAMMILEAFTREGLRRNEYLANVEWVDQHGRKRKGRKWWDPLVDGPLLVLNIDEAHFFLAFKLFTAALTAGARMWRKCGMKIRLGTHTPLLTDLGGSMALRDMLTGGFVWIGRTANSLTGPTAFNGQLPVDPRSIPKIPGMAYVLAGQNPRAMLMRTAWEPDFYDWVRDVDDQPIGYPAQLPQVTLDTFGPEFKQWRDSGLLVPTTERRTRDEPTSDQGADDAVLEVLLAARGPLDPDGLDRALEPYRQQGVKVSIRTARAAVKKLKDAGDLLPTHGRYELTPEARERLVAQRAEAGQ